MATNRLTQGVMTMCSSLKGFTFGPSQEVSRIEALSNDEVRLEFEAIIKGDSYSWHSINTLMQSQLDEGALEFTAIDGDVLFEWNNLCDEKRHWEQNGCCSITCDEFYRDCLINLKIMPTKAGFGVEGQQLVTSNMDDPNLSSTDLWVAPKHFDEYGSAENVGDDDDGSSWDFEDYVDDDSEDDYEEIESTGFEYEDDEYSD
ncbi:hypothetical protein V501_00500 [Pseudogymnoascus sp. VKM F-4519 (FW-2642)]|nr:hypothetical protein V501_00500 [Pseudogymnoascus sp. VKM F-4519 (FW-2642)]